MYTEQETAETHDVSGEDVYALAKLNAFIEGNHRPNGRDYTAKVRDQLAAFAALARILGIVDDTFEFCSYPPDYRPTKYDRRLIRDLLR